MANLSLQYRSIKDTAPLEVRLSFTAPDKKRRNLYAKTELVVSKSFWEDCRNGINFKDEKKINLKTAIDVLYKDLRGYALPLFEDAHGNIKSDWLQKVIKEYYHPKPKEKTIPDKLTEYLDYYLDLRSLELTPGSGSYKKWNEIRNKVKKFEKATGKIYRIKDVDDNFKKDWAKWCNSKKYAPATIAKNLQYIKQICLHSQTKGIAVSGDLLKLSLNIKDKAYPKIYLSFLEMKKIEELEGLSDVLEAARDWLLISCHTGQRVSDFMRFNKSMIRTTLGKKFIDLKQVKTGKDVTVPLMPEVLTILDKRDGEFPPRQLDQKYNILVKEVCQLAGIIEPIRGKLPSVIEVNGKRVKRAIPGTYEKYKLIGSHCGRRSFATNYYGILPTSFLMNITGHSSEAMLMRYIGKTAKETALDAYDIMINTKK